jgi:hypothetical protein
MAPLSRQEGFYVPEVVAKEGKHNAATKRNKIKNKTPETVSALNQNGKEAMVVNVTKNSNHIIEKSGGVFKKKKTKKIDLAEDVRSKSVQVVSSVQTHSVMDDVRSRSLAVTNQGKQSLIRCSADPSECNSVLGFSQTSDTMENDSFETDSCNTSSASSMASSIDTTVSSYLSSECSFATEISQDTTHYSDNYSDSDTEAPEDESCNDPVKMTLSDDPEDREK